MVLVPIPNLRSQSLLSKVPHLRPSGVTGLLTFILWGRSKSPAGPPSCSDVTSFPNVSPGGAQCQRAAKSQTVPL